MSGRVTFLTPIHRRDTERFLFQRESIERCGIELPHIAVANHEDLDYFRDIPYQKNLTVISTREILTAKIERRRCAWPSRRRSPGKWFAGPPIHGWRVQQIIKLAAPRVVDTEGIVCLDCDTFFVRNVKSADFYASNGKLHLYETADDVDAEMAAWPANSLRFLGIKATGLPLYRYTHSPVVLNRDVLLDLHEYTRNRYGGDWMQQIADADSVFEYTTYGVFAREVDRLRRVEPTSPVHSECFWWQQDVDMMEATFHNRVDRPEVRIVGIQSNTGCQVSRYREMVEMIWKKGQGVTDVSKIGDQQSVALS